MWLRTWDVITTLWPNMLFGTGVMLLATAAGWSAARATSLPPVRLVAWWVALVVRPLLTRVSWWARAATIFVNNASILTALTALGRWQWAGWAGIVGVGVSLGIGLRVLANDPYAWMHLGGQRVPSAVRRTRVGVALNLLEPPAIMLAIGLAVGRHAIPLSPAQVWETFALWVLPAILFAACGEALWIGVCRETPQPTASETPESGDSGPDP